MGLLSFLRRKFNLKPTWNGTPEMFLAMVMEFQLRNNKEFSLTEVLKWGEVLQKVMNVDLTPYRNFPDLLQNGTPDYAMVEKMKAKLNEHNQRVELKRAIYGDNVDLGDDNVMKSNSEGAVFAREFIKDLSKHVNFQEEPPEND